MLVGPLKGTLIAFAESLTDANGNLQGWLIGGLIRVQLP